MSLSVFLPVLDYFVPTADVLFIYTKNRRCLHDYLAGTMVVRCPKVW